MSAQMLDFLEVSLIVLAVLLIVATLQDLQVRHGVPLQAIERLARITIELLMSGLYRISLRALSRRRDGLVATQDDPIEKEDGQ